MDGNGRSPFYGWFRMNHGYLGFPIAMPTVIEPLSALAKALVLSRAPSWARSPDERMERFTLETLQDQAESVGWSWLLINLPYFRSCWMAIWEYTTVCPIFRQIHFWRTLLLGTCCHFCWIIWNPKGVQLVQHLNLWCFFFSPGITSIATASPQRTLSDRRKLRAFFFSPPRSELIEQSLDVHFIPSPKIEHEWTW